MMILLSLLQKVGLTNNRLWCFNAFDRFLMKQQIKSMNMENLIVFYLNYINIFEIYVCFMIFRMFKDFGTEKTKNIFVFNEFDRFLFTKTKLMILNMGPLQ